jgi:hypothetical protein
MTLQPLLIHLLFHPKSTSARELARHIHGQLNDDVVVPGLRVPTVFVPYDEYLRPPAGNRFDLAQNSLVVPLADDELVIDTEWCRFVADAWEACDGSLNGRHRCVPMQLTKSAWPLDGRLKEVSFGRAYSQPVGQERNLWVTRRIVIELCRFLQGFKATDDQSDAPIELFLSHAKVDMGADPKVAQQFIDYLTADQPVEAWVDSGEIEMGSKFSDAIRKGVPRTSLLVILTDNYSSREWCREEVMLAKEHERPIAIIDSLMTHEVRSFPFLDNVPRMRWNGSAEAGVDLLLKETLRHLHTRKVLESSKRVGDIIFLRPPEPATLLGVDQGANILYPDPPLGVGELQRLSKSQVTFSTPLERSAEARPLAGKLIALSMSESSDVAQFGMDDVHLTQTMLELSRHLLIRGASLAYGGHLGTSGYTQRLFELVRTYNNLDGVDNFERIVNHRGWPFPKLMISQLAELNSVSTIVSVTRPADINESLSPDFKGEIESSFLADASAVHRYAWCRGMTEMREFQADDARSHVAARIVLGGTFKQTPKANEDGTVADKWYLSRMPGVLEEILLSIKVGQPVFLIGAFGGVADLTIRLLLRKKHRAASWDLQSQAPFASETRNLYKLYGQKWWYYDNEPRITDLRTDDDRSIVQFLADTWQESDNRGWETRLNPLTKKQNQRLFETVDLSEMVELLQVGLNSC